MVSLPVIHSYLITTILLLVSPSYLYVCSSPLSLSPAQHLDSIIVSPLIIITAIYTHSLYPAPYTFTLHLYSLYFNSFSTHYFLLLLPIALIAHCSYRLF